MLIDSHFKEWKMTKNLSFSIAFKSQKHMQILHTEQDARFGKNENGYGSYKNRVLK